MHCAEDIVERMEALRHANKLWASAFSEAAQDKSWFFGGTKTTSGKVHALLGLHFHKLLVNPGVMANWAQQSGAILTQAAQFFPELDVSCCWFDCVKHGCIKQNLPDAKWLRTTNFCFTRRAVTLCVSCNVQPAQCDVHTFLLLQVTVPRQP